MSGDLSAFLSGNIPGGIVLLPIGIFAFTAAWSLTWWGTRFWSKGRFFAILVLGWVVVTAAYGFVWKKSNPPPLPIRVVVIALNHQGEQHQDWRFRGMADIIERRLAASPNHYVLQRTEFTPVLTRYRHSPEKLDSLALLLKARWLITVSPSIQSDSTIPTVHIRQYEKKVYQTKGEFNAGSGSFISEAVSLTGKVLQTLGDNTPPLGQYGLPPNLPDTAFERLNKAILMRETDKYPLAIASLSFLKEEYPKWLRPYQELAICHLEYYSAYHQDDIHLLLLSAIEIDPYDPESYILLTRYFLNFSNWFEAESAAKLAYNRTLDDPRVFYYLSRLYRGRLKDMPLIDKDDNKRHALHLAPGYEAVRLAIAESYRKQLERYTSLKFLNEGLEIDPESIPLLMAKAANLAELRHCEKAEAVCRKILDLSPGNTTALYNLAIAQLFSGQIDEAIATFDSSYSSGGTIENLYYLGVAYQEKGDWDTAVEYFQQRMVRYENYFDQVAVSARERIKRLKSWIAERDSLKALEKG